MSEITIINQDTKQMRDAEKELEEKHLLELQKAKEELEALLSVNLPKI